VGCTVTKDGRIIVTGYNGSIKGLPHCTDENCNADNPCLNTVHAEANAISYAARFGISLIGATLYCTSGPCRKCAELIVQAGIQTVVYLTPYRTTEGIDLLMKCGVNVERIYENDLKLG